MRVRCFGPFVFTRYDERRWHLSLGRAHLEWMVLTFSVRVGLRQLMVTRSWPPHFLYRRASR